MTDDPVANADFEVFVDGSRYYHEESYRTGYAVTTLTRVIKKEQLPPSMSAHEAEL